MSIKKEYDLTSSGEIPVTTGDSFGIESEFEEPLVDNIDIKFELPYQSVQFQLSSDDDEEQLNNSTEATDPLAYGDDDKHHQQIPSSNQSFTCAPVVSTSKKLKKISTAICTKCNIGFPSPFLFEQHMIQVHQDDRPYPCKHCGKPFSTPAQQKCHETIHDPRRFEGEPQYSCDICSKSYHLKRSLATHKLKTHLGYKPPKRRKSAPVIEHHSTSGFKNPNGYRKPKQIYSCPQCDLTFEMKCLLQKHMIIHTKERPFSCPICQQPFPRRMSMVTHIRRIHQTSTTPTGKSRIRPKYLAGQPCPCTICGKVFRLPSQLSRHILLHTGEKPHSCKICNKTFRLSGDLSYHIKQNHLKNQLVGNQLKLFKCRICGKNDFVFFRDLRQHRIGVHRNIPYDSEKEKPFGCGICGKPHFLREGALICAVLGHDPSPLKKEMFKIKCPECPPGELNGYHSVLALRRHWLGTHEDKQLPQRFRIGMHGDKIIKDELPKCRIDKRKRQLIQMNGLDEEEHGKVDVPLYTELDLLEVPENERFFKRTRKRKVVVKDREHFCEVCGLKLASSCNLKRHLKVVHNPKRKNKDKFNYECTICGNRYVNMGLLKKHEYKFHPRGEMGKLKNTEVMGKGKKLCSDKVRILLVCNLLRLQYSIAI